MLVDKLRQDLYQYEKKTNECLFSIAISVIFVLTLTVVDLWMSTDEASVSTYVIYWILLTVGIYICCCLVSTVIMKLYLSKSLKSNYNGSLIVQNIKRTRDYFNVVCNIPIFYETQETEMKRSAIVNVIQDLENTLKTSTIEYWKINVLANQDNKAEFYKYLDSSFTENLQKYLKNKVTQVDIQVNRVIRKSL